MRGHVVDRDTTYALARPRPSRNGDHLVRVCVSKAGRDRLAVLTILHGPSISDKRTNKLGETIDGQEVERRLGNIRSIQGALSSLPLTRQEAKQSH